MSTVTGPRGPSVTSSGAISSNPLPAGGPRVPLPTDKELVLKVVPMPADCNANGDIFGCLLYTSPSPRDRTRSRMPSSA